MNLNDVALLYAALGVSWGGIAAFRQVKEFHLVLFGNGDISKIADGNENLETLMRESREKFRDLDPLFVGIAVAVVAAILFVTNGISWPIGVLRAVVRGKA